MPGTGIGELPRATRELSEVRKVLKLDRGDGTTIVKITKNYQNCTLKIGKFMICQLYLNNKI